MNIMVVGGGGREHAIIKKLRADEPTAHVYSLPGNGGIAADATCVPIAATDIPAIVAWAAENAIDYAVVAPDDPLVAGCVDALAQAGIPAFGPRANAAIIEGSKAFSKDLMRRYGIPTAAYATFTDMDAALAYVANCAVPVVVKADGLALGKGVIICATNAEAQDAVRLMMEEGKFGASGNTVVVEEFLTGPEVSVLAFTDGKTLVPMVSSMDHKRVGDGDTGLNTGGMGTVAPNPYYTPAVAARCMEEIFLPTMAAMNAEGRPFAGCLYFGLMLTEAGPKVIEYNCRFGDPETQVVLPLLKSNLLDIMRACTEGRLAEVDVEFACGAAACVIMASGGYPGSYAKGVPIELTGAAGDEIYVAGAALDADGALVTSGGRVLGVGATAPTLEAALALAYERVEGVRFAGAHYRRDIGQRALAALR